MLLKNIQTEEDRVLARESFEHLSVMIKVTDIKKG